MKHFKYRFAVLLLCISSCRYQDHAVQISAIEPKLEFKNYYNKNLDLNLVDNRKNKDFIGFRAPISIWKAEEEYKDPNYFLKRDEYHYKIANLINNQDLVDLVKQKLSANLKQKGLKLKRFSINKIKIEILELNLVPTMYRNFISSKIKITASNKYNNLDKIYEKNIVSYRPMLRVLLMGPFDFGSSGEYYDDIINECLNQNIEQIVNDDQIWSFL